MELWVDAPDGFVALWFGGPYGCIWGLMFLTDMGLHVLDALSGVGATS